MSHAITSKLIIVFFLLAVLPAGNAQRYERDRYDDRRDDYRQDSYDYCRDEAKAITGYRGRTPSRYRQGQALEGAIKGAKNAAGLAWITGGNSEDRKKAAKRGAALGALIGGIKAGQQRERERRADRLRRDYEFEVRACMDAERDRQELEDRRDYDDRQDRQYRPRRDNDRRNDNDRRSD